MRLYSTVYIFLILCFLAMVPALSGMAQCPNTSINVSSAACVGDTITASLSTSFERYFWDADPGDLTSTPVATNLGNIENALTNPRNITIVQDAGNWYGFINNASAAIIYRLHFGNSFENSPSLDTVNFTATASNGGTTESKIRFVKEGANWYGLQVTDQERLLVHQFGNSLTNNNLTTNAYVNPFGLFADPKDLVIVEQNDSVFAVVINRSSDNISIVRFGNSISNAPISGYNESILEDSSYLNNSACLEVKKYCDDWFVFAASPTTDNIVRVNFGAYFNGSATGTALFTNGSISNPKSIEITEENGNFYGFVKSNAGTGISFYEFGSNLSSVPAKTDYTNFGGLTNGTQAQSIDVINDGSKWYAFVTNAQNNQDRIIRLDYSDTAAAAWGDTSQFSFVASNIGTTHLSFIGVNSAGNTFFGVDSIEVFASPDVDFNLTQLCDNHESQFTDISTSTDSIDTCHWDFGTGDTSILQDPSYLFPDSGLWNIQFTATTENGCNSILDSTLYVYKAPVALFTIDSTCQFAMADISESSAAFQDTLSSWTWTFESDTATGQSPAIMFDSSGQTTLSLIVESGAGCLDTLDEDVFIKLAPASNFDLSTTCLGDTTLFQNQSTFGAGTMSYVWNLGEGPLSTATNPSHLYSAIGGYNSKLRVTGSNGCLDSTEVLVTVSVPPAVQFGISESSICSYSDLHFLDSSTVSQGSIIAWEWSFGDGDSSLVQNPIKSYAAIGVFETKLRAYSGTKCSQVDSLDVTVLESPVVGFSASATCMNQNTIFQSATTTPASDSVTNWNWVIETQSVSTADSAQYSFGDSTSHLIRFEVTSALGCIQSIDSTLQILSAPTAQIVDLGNLLCTNLELGYDASISTSYLDSLSTIDWFVVDGTQIANTGTGLPFSPTLAHSGIYQVGLLVESEAGCTVSDTLLISVGESPVSTLEYNVACAGDTTFFMNNYSGSNYQYGWSFGDGLNSANDDPFHIYNDSGTYIGTHLITNELNQCFDYDSFIVVVNPRPIPQFLNDPICQGSWVNFRDNTSLEEDSIVSAKWDFIGLESNDAFSPSIFFEDEGETLVRYQIETANKCRASINQIITILPKPDLEFNLEPSYGQAPLEVSLNNASIDSVEYFWIVNAKDTLTVNSFTFDTNALYEVSFVATRDDGCVARLDKTINIAEVEIDLAIQSLEATLINEDQMAFVATVVNLGNVAIEDLQMRVSLNQQGTFNEFANRTIEPSKFYEIKLNGLLDLGGKEFDISCIDLNFDQEFLDVDPSNNELCISDNSKSIISKPYPNPSNSAITFAIVSPKQKNHVSFEAYNSKGELMLMQEETAVTDTYDTMTIDISTLSTGIYLINVHTDDVSEGFKVIKF
ncbi:MAG TPA: hypothetical protein DCX14_11220 [Flavobacteriales bacterium]|nr:hypothetical protein [Flavobacteriales bacterium]